MCAGKLILYETVQWAFANGIRWLDFGTGAQPYKFLFTNTYVPLIREITVPLNPIGTIYTTARTLWRKRKQRHPAILRNSSR